MKKRTIALTLCVCLLMGLFTGCGKTKDGQTSAKTRDDLVVILPNDFTTLDPQMLPASADINFCANIFDGLVEVDPDTKEIKPSLAESWDISDDGMSYTFHLKKGVKFHNEDEMKASDVVYTCKRFAEQAWMQFASFMIQDSEAVDDYTVKINLKYPYANFLGEISYMYVTSEKYMNEAGDKAAKNPIGTGAYKFVKWDVSQQIVLEANKDYFAGAPSIKKLTFKIIPDSNTAFVALEKGEADLNFNVSAVDYNQAKENPDLETDEVVGNSYYAANFNSDRVDEKVRQALAYAIDKEAVNVLVNEGQGVVTDIPLEKGQEGYADKSEYTTYAYDVEKSKKLLAEAGAKDLELDFFYGESTANGKLAQALQSMFSEVGVTLELKPVETGTWWQMFGDGDYDMSRGGYPMEDVNTDAPYFDMYHKDGTFNVSRINDPDINNLLEQARVEMDADKRDKMYVEVQKIIMEKAYVIPLYFNLSTVVYNPALKNVKAIHNQKYIYKNMSWKE